MSSVPRFRFDYIANSICDLANGVLLSRRGLVVSIVRFNFFYSHQSDDFTWISGNRGIWCEVEPAAYLICACLMTFKPLVAKATRLKGRVRGLTGGVGHRAYRDPAPHDDWIPLD